MLDYLQSTGQTNPEIQLTAEKYVATGYQRLLTFEVEGGGFSLMVEALGLGADVSAALQEFPNKKWDQLVPTDPVIYRLYEIVGVYGETKLAGERQLLETGAAAVVLRTSSIPCRVHCFLTRKRVSLSVNVSGVIRSKWLLPLAKLPSFAAISPPRRHM